jgi:protein-tyrosine phosphatase
MQVATLEPGNLDQALEIAQRAAAVLRDGGLVVFPTETVYGVAASAASDRAIDSLQELKGGEPTRAFTVHLPDPASAERYIDTASPALGRLIRKVFPGPVTLVVDVSEDVINQKLRQLGLAAYQSARIYQNNTVSLRCPDHPLTQRILGLVSDPVLAMSAARPGERHAHDAREAMDAVGERVDLVVDGGRCRYAKPSTIVRVRGQGLTRSIQVERPGVYDERFIRKLMRWTVLLVCSGNTCRSPMAEGIAKQMLAEQRGIAVEDLETSGLRVTSAGILAAGGMPANEEAVAAMAKQGIDLTSHRSRPLTLELIHEADVIYCMTEAQRGAVLGLSPAAGEKTFTLDPTGDIDDPLGAGAKIYQRTAELIRRRLAQRLKEQQP